MDSILEIDPALALEAQNGGLFIARNTAWIHPERTINSFELIFVKDGVLYLKEDKQEFEVRAGETLLLWPGKKHGGMAASANRLKFYWAHFTVASKLPAAADGDDAYLSARQHVRIARPDHLTALFQRLLDDQELFGTKSLTLSLLIMLMMCEIARSSRVPLVRDGSASMLASRADVVIQTKFQQPISTSTIAAELHCNPDYLGRIFRSLYGKPLTDAINERRVRYAAALLAESRSSIDDISRLCGFTNPSYFRRVFKRIQGMTPNTFRSLYTRTHINFS